MANALRFLAVDAVERARSGHPGMPMGMADCMLALARDVLVFDPSAPDWPNRDRLVLSAGHGSMLLYAFAYLTGFADTSIEDIRNFRQWKSRTPGHPERGHTSCVETTTGPLGQGLGTAVGMALAERMLAKEFGSDLVGHHTYAIVGDGCLMEGISHEAISLAGHLGLGRLIVLFDSNRISIDGPTSLSGSDDHRARFGASGWHVQDIDGHDPDALVRAIDVAKTYDTRPSMIECRTIIGFGAPSGQGRASVHGAPLGEDEIDAARKALHWNHPPFLIPEDILLTWRQFGRRGADRRKKWEMVLDRHPKKDEWNRRMQADLPKGWQKSIRRCAMEWGKRAPKWATRQSSGEVLNVLAPIVPELIGGSADLTGSNNTLPKGAHIISSPDYRGNYLHYGVREVGMASLMNGLACHGGFIPYGGTFLVFSDYCRSAMRLSALMKIGVVYVMTHDSIALGEDGPTHQPIEHLAALRAMPGLLVFRPADAIETAECWEIALLRRRQPSVLCLSRQGLATFRTDSKKNLSMSGAYAVASVPDGKSTDISFLASGSEVSLALQARDRLVGHNIGARVVSMPCWELFEELDEKEKIRILGPNTLRIAVEAASGFGWERYTHSLGAAGGAIVGMTDFGASAPGDDLMRHFSFTVEHLVDTARRLCKQR